MCEEYRQKICDPDFGLQEGTLIHLTMSAMSNRMILIIVACTLALGGCINPTSTRNVTNEAKYQVGYAPGQIYRLRTDLSLIDERTDDGKRSIVYVYPH